MEKERKQKFDIYLNHMLSWLNERVGKNIDPKLLSEDYHRESQQYAKEVGIF